MDHDQTSIFVRKAVDGADDGVSWIVTHFQPFVEAQARFRLRGHGSQQDVEDIASEVWMVTLSNLANLRPREGRLAPVLVTFLGTTVLQTCNNFLRKRARRGIHGAGAAGDDAPPGVSQLPADTLGVVTRAVQRDLGDAVGRCLDDLNEDKREVLVLRLMEQRTNQEIGELLGIPANTVAVRFRRAIEELRAVLPSELLSDIESVAS
jgi:RNA polymerase sigma-70 factor, ECF subfamily